MPTSKRRHIPGGSAASNPTASKHRQAAAARAGMSRKRDSALTSAALRKHDADHLADAVEGAENSMAFGGGMRMGMNEAPGDESFPIHGMGGGTGSGGGGGGGDMFASVRRMRNSALSAHTEACAVLEAVTEMIREQEGAEETPTAYWGALMTTLEQVAAQGEPGGVAAVAFLLALVTPHVPHAVLQRHAARPATVLESTLARYESPDAPQALVKSLLACLGALVRAQDATSWATDAVGAEGQLARVHALVCGYVADARPKVRRTAQRQVVATCQALAESAPAAPGAASSAAHQMACEAAVQPCADALAGPSEASALHGLGLLAELLPHVPARTAKRIMPALLEALGRKQPMFATTCHTALRALFVGNARLSARVIDSFLSALLEYAPSLEDAARRSSWVAVLRAALERLAQIDPAAALARAPTVCAPMLECLLADKDSLARKSTAALQGTLATLFGRGGGGDRRRSAGASSTTTTAAEKGQGLEGPLTPLAIQEAAAAAAGGGGGGGGVSALVDTLSEGLRYRYQPRYGAVLRILGTLLAGLGAAATPLCDALVVQLVELHATPAANCRPHVEQVLSAFVRAVGPEAFLEVVPLELGSWLAAAGGAVAAGDGGAGGYEEADFSRAWLLPLLKGAVQGGSLGYFRTVMLPLASDLMAARDAAMSEEREVMARAFGTLYAQVWDLLPGWCDGATDLGAGAGFRNMARLLGQAITDHEELRDPVCKALKAVLQTAQRNSEHNPDGLVSVAMFAKNFLPLLFNAYEAMPAAQEGRRRVVLSTVTSYAAVAEPALVNTFFRTALRRLIEASTMAAKAGGVDAPDAGGAKAARTKAQHDMMDLALALAGRIDGEAVSLLFRVVAPQLQEQNATLQKKSYRALLVALETEGFVASHAEALAEMLPGSYVTASPAAKLPRLRCLQAVLPRLPEELLPRFVELVFIEIMLATKEVNERTRERAYDLLVGIGQMAAAAGEKGQQDAAMASAASGGFDGDAFLSMLFAGLGGDSPHTISAAVLSLTRVVFEFRAVLSPPLLAQTIEAMLVLLGHPAREVVKSVLSYLKMAIMTNDRDYVAAAILGPLVDGMTAWKPDHKGHFRQKARVLVERLVRKCGYDAVWERFPESDRKLLVHIRKERERNKKQKKRAAFGGEASSATAAAAAGGASSTPKEMLGYEDYIMSSGDEAESAARPGRRGPRHDQQQGDTQRQWIHEAGTGDTGEGSPLDLLDPSAVASISSSRPRTRRHANEAGVDAAFGRSRDGRLLIQEEEDGEESGAGGKRKRGNGRSAAEQLPPGYEEMLEDSEDEGGLKGFNYGSGIHRDRNRRARAARAERAAGGGGDGESGSEQEAGGEATDRSGAMPLAPGRHPKRAGGVARESPAIGRQFRSTKAAGDVQRKGQVQPYAFVAFDKQHMNKRKKNKVASEFKKAVKAGKNRRR